MFFASCCWKGGRWHPLTNAETETDEQLQYGMLFHAPSWIMTSRMASELYSQYQTVTSHVLEYDRNGNPLCYEILKHPVYHGQPSNVVLPIGFQPFMRCSMQNGYGIYMRALSPLQKDTAFEKLRFRHNENLANWIYKEMDEGLTEVQFIIDQIRNLHEFPKEALKYAVYRSHYFKLEDIYEVRSKLEKFCVDEQLIRIVPHRAWYISKKYIRETDNRYRDFSLSTSCVKALRRKKTNSGPGIFAPWMLMSDENEPGVIDFGPVTSRYDVSDFSQRIIMSLLTTMMTKKPSDF